MGVVVVVIARGLGYAYMIRVISYPNLGPFSLICFCYAHLPWCVNLLATIFILIITFLSILIISNILKVSLLSLVGFIAYYINLY